MRLLTIAFLTLAMLRCEEQGFPYWRQVLLYGESKGVLDIPVDGRERHILFISFHKRDFVFIFQYPELPGAREPGAWHGCGLYELRPQAT